MGKFHAFLAYLAFGLALLWLGGAWVLWDWAWPLHAGALDYAARTAALVIAIFVLVAAAVVSEIADD